MSRFLQHDGTHAPKGPSQMNPNSWQARGLRMWLPLVDNDDPIERYKRLRWDNAYGRVREPRSEIGGYGSNNVSDSMFQNRIRYFRPGVADAPLTFTSLCILETQSDFQPIIASRVADGGDNIVMGGDDNGAIFISDYNDQGWQDGGATIKLNELVLLAGVIRGATDFSNYQISQTSGLERSDFSRTIGVTGSLGLKFVVGEDPNGILGRIWKGPIFDIRMYDRALSDDELYGLWHPQTRWDLYDTFEPPYYKAAAGRIMSSLTHHGGLAGSGGIAGHGGGLAA